MDATASAGNGKRQTTSAAKAIQGWPEAAKILTVSTSLDEAAAARGRDTGIGMTLFSRVSGE